MGILISGSNGIDMGGNPVSNASQIETQESLITPYTGFKNYIINGKKTINQRGLTYTDNSYNQDRWYKAGNNWFQGIEGDNNLISGKTYTLSWIGSATASYYVGTAISSTINVQTFTPITNGGNLTLTITVGQNLWIKFVSDATGSTFNFVQLEQGNVATPFENIPIGLQLSLCQRYYEYDNLCAIKCEQLYDNRAGTQLEGMINFKVQKRVSPSMSNITFSSGTYSAIARINTKGLVVQSTGSSTSDAVYINSYIASAEL